MCILLIKGENVNSVKNWRPIISMCSVDRRVYEKILDKCLKEHMSLYSIQKGFIRKPRTHINTNVLNNILNDAKQKKKDCCIFILDIKKAYNNVSHYCISEVLELVEMSSLLSSR